MRYSLVKFVKTTSALGALPPDSFGFRRLRIRSRLVFVFGRVIVIFKKSIKIVCKATVLVIKPLIDIAKEQTADWASFSIQTLYFLLVRAQ